MRLKNITFSSPVAVFSGFASLESFQKPATAKSMRMLGPGMVLYSKTPGEVSERRIFSEIQNPFRTHPTLYRVQRGTSTHTEIWKRFLLECLRRGVKETTAFGIIADFSIPKEAEEYSQYLQEVRLCAAAFCESQVPLLVQVSVITPPDVVRQISEIAGVDGVVLSEYLPWNTLPKEVRTVFFNRIDSPYPGGGMTVGKYWTPIALEWITQVRRAGVLIPMLVGGFLRGRDVKRLIIAGASAVYLGRAVSALRPWQNFFIRREARKHCK